MGINLPYAQRQPLTRLRVSLFFFLLLGNHVYQAKVGKLHSQRTENKYDAQRSAASPDPGRELPNLPTDQVSPNLTHRSRLWSRFDRLRPIRRDLSSRLQSSRSRNAGLDPQQGSLD